MDFSIIMLYGVTEYKEIKNWLESMGINNYEIHETGAVSVNGDVYVTGRHLKYLQVQPKEWAGPAITVHYFGNNK